ncbi:MAG: phospho-N-acetylmuramoyl-pentapeptide-transferase [Acidimicrobiia bacterium]|nr:phospho-N-acetylmuramoyl-pentapeptide-transferase [Acidimicrobiia bacterium]
MISLLTAGAVSFAVTLFLTPYLIRVLRARNIGQFIQEEVEGHLHKRGTPTMGGIVILLAVTAGYFFAHMRFWVLGKGFTFELREISLQGLLVLFAFLGMGLIGFLDDYTKYARKQNLGLSKRWKFIGQLVIAGVFAWGAAAADTSTELAFTRGLGIDLGPIGYAFLVLLMLTGAANAVNLADGLDGLAAGSAALVFGAFMILGFWQFRNITFYEVEGALGLGIMAAALLGSALGFLWWNAAPAKIFMGDVGSQALGGAMAGLALLTNTHLLLIVIGGLYVMITVSVILQVASFKMFGKRIFRMAPIHHHFELVGWPETTIIVRFWILAGLGVGLGLGIFYGDFVANAGAILP